MAMLLWHLQIGKGNLILAKLKDDFINLLHFSSRLTGLTFKLMSFCKISRTSVPAFYLQILVIQKNFFTFLWTVHRFHFDYFHISVHSFIWDRKHKTVSWGEEVYVTLSFHVVLTFVIIWLFLSSKMPSKI